jgi:hypothetical protein
MLITYFVPVKEFANLGKRNRQKSLRRTDNSGVAHQISARTNRRADPRRTSGSWGNVLREQDLRTATPPGRFPQDLITRRLSTPGHMSCRQLRQPIQPEVERWCRMSQTADADPVYAGFGDISDRRQVHASRCF